MRPSHHRRLLGVLLIWHLAAVAFAADFVRWIGNDAALDPFLGKVIGAMK